MFGLGFGEILIILVLALVLLGPKRLPDAAKQLGKAMRDFQRATADVKHQFDSAMYEVDKAVKAYWQNSVMRKLEELTRDEGDEPPFEERETQ